MLPVAVLLAFHAWLDLLGERPAIVRSFGGSRWLAMHVGASVAQWLYLVAFWVEGGGGYFWPAWPLLGLGLLAGVHALSVTRSTIRP